MLHFMSEDFVMRYVFREAKLLALTRQARICICASRMAPRVPLLLLLVALTLSLALAACVTSNLLALSVSRPPAITTNMKWACALDFLFQVRALTAYRMLAWGFPDGGKDNTTDVQVVDIDIDAQADRIPSLLAAGQLVICYFSGGSIEYWRPDVIANKSAWDSVALGLAEGWYVCSSSQRDPVEVEYTLRVCDQQPICSCLSFSLWRFRCARSSCITVCCLSTVLERATRLFHLPCFR